MEGRGRFASRLTGTYTVDPARSDKVGRAAKIATREISTEEQQRLREMITRRLAAPEMIAIQREGRSITVASTRSPQVTFEADGRDRTEQSPRGRTIRVNARLAGDQLVVTSTGDRGNDFTVTFEPVANGSELRVTRRMEVETLTQPVMATSYYTRTSEVAQLDLYRESAPDRAPNSQDRTQDRTQLVATLDNPLSDQTGPRGSAIHYDSTVTVGIRRLGDRRIFGTSQPVRQNIRTVGVSY